MTTDNKDVVQPEQASEGAASETQPSELEVLKTQIDDAVKSGLDAQLPDIEEKIKRRVQGTFDQEKHRETRRMQDQSAQRIKQVGDRLHEADPEVAKEFQSSMDRDELAELRREKATQVQKDEGQKALDVFYEGLGENLKTLGIGSDDPRVDWGREFNGLPPAKDLTEVNTRYMASVAKILVEDRAKMTPNLEEQKRQLVDEVRKELGIKVDTDSPSGSATSAEWYDRYTQGLEPMNDENKKRARAEYDKRQTET